MQGRSDLELVRIGLVAESTGQLVRVACEAALGYEEDGAVDGTGVWLRAVIDRRIQCVEYVADDLIIDTQISGAKIDFCLGVCPDAWVCEFDAFVRVVSGHDLNVLVEGPGFKENARIRWDKDSVHSRAICVFAVFGVEDLVEACADHGSGGGFSCFGYGGDIEEREEVAGDVLLSESGKDREPGTVMC